MLKCKKKLKVLLKTTFLFSKQLLPFLIGVMVVWTQTSCIMTDYKKSVSAYKDVKDGTEILTSLSERESITQTDESVTFLAPLHLVLSVFTLGFWAIIAPWYSDYEIAFKSIESKFEPDGTLREIEERQGFLHLDFGSYGIPITYGAFIEQNRENIFEAFRYVSEKDFKISKRKGPIRMSEELEGRLRKTRKFTEQQLTQISRLLQTEEVEFAYDITTRRPDGSINKEVNNQYTFINEDIPSEPIILKWLTLH